MRINTLPLTLLWFINVSSFFNGVSAVRSSSVNSYSYNQESYSYSYDLVSDPCLTNCTCSTGNIIINCKELGFTQISPDLPIDVLFADFSNNNISDIEAGSFHGYSGMLWLFLHRNDFLKIKSYTFDGLKHLQQLDLKYNKIKDLEEKAFVTEDDSSSIEKLYLGNNDINNIEQRDFEGLSKLEVLRLQYNSIETLEADTFIETSNLLELILKHNQIKYISPNAFRGLQNVNQIDLAYNKIKGLDHQVLLHTPHVTQLTLSHNDFDQWDVSDIQPWVLPDIASMQMRSCGLTDNHMTFLSDVPVLYFDGTNNALTEIPKTLRGNSNLVVLDLKFNSIIYIYNDSFNGMVNVESINLKGNGLRWIEPMALANLSSLTKVNLNNNTLETLSRDVFSPNRSPNLYGLTLSNNPWHCDCRLNWIKLTLLDLHDTIICNKPENYHGLAFNNNMTLAEEEPTLLDHEIIITLTPDSVTTLTCPITACPQIVKWYLPNEIQDNDQYQVNIEGQLVIRYPDTLSAPVNITCSIENDLGYLETSIQIMVTKITVTSIMVPTTATPHLSLIIFSAVIVGIVALFTLGIICAVIGIQHKDIAPQNSEIQQDRLGKQATQP